MELQHLQEMVQIQMYLRQQRQRLRRITDRGFQTVKPWNIETIREKMDMVQDCGAKMVAMDIDAAGLPFLQNLTPPAGSNQ